ncbi:hypothetical protein [Butyribacter sp.]|uniref:hypothetical protein n=1 Tax=Butyribacter sp. TaxID=2822465 RepID=UPI002A9BD34C|nr:hypothetical protein [Butyribacter sp.]
MANTDKELFKFVNDPKYREKVINRIHKEEDHEYAKRVKTVKNERDKIIKARNDEIKRIENSRWEKYADGKLEVNRTEGKAKINGTECLFSSIKGASLNMMSGARIVTTEQSHSKSKKHASIGGAVVGGMILGPVGAVAGGVGLGKTKTKTSGSTVSNQIPTCIHLGVTVNIDGFISEIVLISSQVDQASIAFNKAQSEAQALIAQLGCLAHTQVPTSFLRPDEEMSVKNIDVQIANKQKEVEIVIENRPTYALPLVYRMPQQQKMSDAEYLQYLSATDEQRAAQRIANEVAFKQEQKEKKAVRRYQREQNRKNTVYAGNRKKVGTIIYSIAFWIFSIFDLLFALTSFSSTGVTSGMIFLITAALINPKIDDLVSENLFKIPKWIIFIVMIVGFFAGVLTFPDAQ